jgi:hypothetical protein
MKPKPLLMEKLADIRANHDRSRSRILLGWDLFNALWRLAEQFEASAEGRTAGADIQTWGDLNLTMHLRREDSFKAADSILAAVLDLGWEATRNVDDGFSLDYYFKDKDGRVLVVIIWPDYRSQICKRVMVGKKEVEEFKLVCEEEPAEGVEHATAGTPT